MNPGPWFFTRWSDVGDREKRRLLVVDKEGNKRAVSGLPDVGYGGQGGMGDVALPGFCD